MDSISILAELIRNGMKASLGVCALLASLLVFAPAANASCERTIYNKSDSIWVVAVYRSNLNKPTSAEMQEYVAKGQKVIKSHTEGWEIIIYPNETRRIHYDDTYWHNLHSSYHGEISIRITSYSDYPYTYSSPQTFDLIPYRGWNALAGFFGGASCGYIDPKGKTGRVTLNNPADGDIILEAANIEDNCINLYTGKNGLGERLNICEGIHNWKPYTNLGGVGDRIHSHHYAVKSFQCGSGIDHLMFVDGNRDSVAPILQNCQGGITSNVDAAVTKHGTGVGVYR